MHLRSATRLHGFNSCSKRALSFCTHYGPVQRGRHTAPSEGTPAVLAHSPVIDLDHATKSGVIRMRVGPNTATSELDTAAGLLPVGWHVCGFTDEELYGPEVAAELAALSELSADKWSDFGMEAQESLMMNSTPIESGVFRVSGHPTTHTARCAAWSAPLVMGTV